MKLNEKVTCPYCGHEDWYTFHIDSDSLYCHKCDKEFAIKLQQVIITKVLSDVLNTHECYGCDTKFNDSNMPENRMCPTCKVMLHEIEYKDSPVYCKWMNQLIHYVIRIAGF
jgi:uncharacterized protein YbaR (Trm112 family)